MAKLESKVIGAAKLAAVFDRLKAEYGKDCVGRVSFTAPYAMRVHEDLEVPHLTGGAKFLTRAVDATRKAVKQLIDRLMRRKTPLKDAVQEAMDLVKADAQTKCPIRTGFLRDSAVSEVIDA